MSDEPYAASPAEVQKAIKALRPLASGYAYSWAVRDVLDEIECLRSRLESAEQLTELKQGIIEAADTRIRELESRLESAERDTARIEWLREYANTTSDGYGPDGQLMGLLEATHGRVSLLGFTLPTVPREEKDWFRAAIDRAIRDVQLHSPSTNQGETNG